VIKNIRNSSIIILIILIFPNIISLAGYDPYQPELSPHPMLGVNVLVLVATSFSYNEYIPTREKLELFGCDVKMVGPTETVWGEDGQYHTMDYLITEVDVSNFDCVFIPGGSSPSYLVGIPEALTLVQEAYSEGLVLAAICHAPMVLASADIISGHNISGNTDIQPNIEAAGATFVYGGVIISGPFVTADYNLAEIFHVGIVQALGYYESDPPELLFISAETENLGDKIKLVIELELADEFGIDRVWATIRRTSGLPDTVNWGFIYYEEEDVYNTTITREWNGTYEIYLELRDNLENEIDIINATSFYAEIIASTEETANYLPLLSLLAIGTPIIIYRYRKKR
jgi:putative intracellular protease/amidase